MTRKLPSLTIFFPFYNDAGTVQQAISEACTWGSAVADKLEIIAIHGGPSRDNTFEEIKKAKRQVPDLVVLDKSDNREGYAVIKHGFKHAKNEWIFYTDGDLQYSLVDLPKLVKVQQRTNADVVNGYKLRRGDGLIRTFLGNGYMLFTKLLFRPPVRDVTCDFRLIRTKAIRPITIRSNNASILIEVLTKMRRNGTVFAETAVTHRPRVYGTSSYKPSQLLAERLFGDIKLYFAMRKQV